MSLEGRIMGLCPVEGEGSVDGHEFYFKARGQRWKLYVAAVAGEAGDPLDASAWSTGAPWGDDPHGAGYMSEEEAWRLIEEGVAKWRAERERKAAVS